MTCSPRPARGGRCAHPVVELESGECFVCGSRVAVVTADGQPVGMVERCPFRHAPAEPCGHPAVERYVCPGCGEGWLYPTAGRTALAVHLDQYHGPGSEA